MNNHFINHYYLYHIYKYLLELETKKNTYIIFKI